MLYLTPQTVSSQIWYLDEAINAKLFTRVGRGLVLSEVGRMVYQYADQMYRLGAELIDVFTGRTPAGPLLFTVGIAELVPKLISYRVSARALRLGEAIHIDCREGKRTELTADRAVQVDMVPADSAVTPMFNLRAVNQLLGESNLSFFAAKSSAARRRKPFPRCLDGAPLLLPTDNTRLRRAMEQWFDAEAISPLIAAVLEDSARATALNQAGARVFTAPSAIGEEVKAARRREGHRPHG
ncbi:MAG: LysR family transcriptional regulator [Gammaproteobacteria bacterium]